MSEVAPAVHEQSMPMEKHGIADRLAIAAEEIRHEFCSTRLGGIGAAVVGLNS